MKYSKTVVMVLASLLPVVCIAVLYKINSIGWRLGAMAFFTAAFTVVLAIFTSAREIEVFAGTAAYVLTPLPLPIDKHRVL